MEYRKITVWVGILELSTGKLTAANAGHEYPTIKRADSGFEIYKDKHGFVIGGMEGMIYKEYTIALTRGGNWSIVKSAGIDFGDPAGWGPLCWTSLGWEVV